jgi:hypothetical protein
MSEAEPEPRGIALLLDDWPAVSPTRENLLCPLVYDQLRNLAESLMSHERVDRASPIFR